MSHELLISGFIAVIVLIAVICIFELFRAKAALNDTIKELHKLNNIAKSRGKTIETLKIALGHATKGKCRHPEKGFFIGKEEFYAYFGLKE
ncbi:MAG: hypothetical protein AAGB32_00845 [Pseudomonadota bacterium]